MKTLGAVFAGGESQRFGSDKAAAVLDGVPLIDHAIAALRPWTDAVVVCGRGHAGLKGLVDRPGGRIGPLAALNAALHHARAEGFDRVLTIACDMPVLPAEIARALLAGGSRVVAGQPMLGCWATDLADALDAHLAASGDRSMRGWVRAAGAATVAAGGRELPNINTPADLAAYMGC